jgi:hypothetical protein
MEMRMGVASAGQIRRRRIGDREGAAADSSKPAVHERLSKTAE